MLSKFLDIVNRSILEYSSDIEIDITEAELATLPSITQQACEQFATECIAARAELARFAKVETQRGRNRQVVSESEEDRNKVELELARSVMVKESLASGQETDPQQQSTPEIGFATIGTRDVRFRTFVFQLPTWSQTIVCRR